MSRLTLLSFESRDRVMLPALLYEPDRRGKRVALWLHGNGGASVFYSDRRMNVLGEALTAAGISFFTFNNRGAETEKVLKRQKGTSSEYVTLGFAHELLRDCVLDIDGAIAHLRALGYDQFFLLGHSTGANKICHYDFHKRTNPFTAYALLGPGDDVGIYYDQLGAQRFDAASRRAQEMIASGRGSRIVPRNISSRPISWASLYDTINPDGDYNTFPFLEVMRGLRLSRRKPLFQEYRKLRRPTLVLFGAEDEYCFGDVPRCMEILQEMAGEKARYQFEMIEDAGHSFHGKEEELAGNIVGFLRKTVRRG